MAKEDFRQRVLEEEIFNELKNIPLKNSAYFKKKYQGVDINYSRIYRRIVNYQVKNYGVTLSNSEFVYSRNKEELKKEHQKARQRRYYRRNKC